MGLSEIVKERMRNVSWLPFVPWAATIELTLDLLRFGSDFGFLSSDFSKIKHFPQIKIQYVFWMVWKLLRAKFRRLDPMTPI